MQSRALVKERAQRNLLLLIDGAKSEEMLLASVAGLKPEDFKTLEELKLIVQGQAASNRAAASAPPAPPVEEHILDYPEFTAALTQIISNELGLRGFTLTLAVEKAGSIEELREVARRALELVRERNGAAAAEKARRTLFGG